MYNNHHKNYCNYEIDKASNIKIKTIKVNIEKSTKVKRNEYTPFEIQKLLLTF